MSTTVDGSGGKGPGSIPGAVVAAVTVIILAVLAAVTFLVASGKSPETVVAVIGLIVGPTVTALLAIRNSHRIGEVANKVDGKLDNLVTDKAHLEQQLSLNGIVPVTSRVSWDPESTGPQPRVLGTDTMPNGMPAQNPGRHSGR